MNAAKALTVADIPRLPGELRQEKFHGFVLNPIAQRVRDELIQ